MGEEGKRYKFGKDDDGHWYLLPAEKAQEFVKWVEWSSKYWSPSVKESDKVEWEGEDFEEYAIGGRITGYSFSDPREDE